MSPREQEIVDGIISVTMETCHPSETYMNLKVIATGIYLDRVQPLLEEVWHEGNEAPFGSENPYA
jgi:hypothetical protein